MIMTTIGLNLNQTTQPSTRKLKAQAVPRGGGGGLTKWGDTIERERGKGGVRRGRTIYMYNMFLYILYIYIYMQIHLCECVHGRMYVCVYIYIYI